MQVAFLMVVCEGEERIAWDTLSALAESCDEHDTRLLLVDDASPSKVGPRLAARFAEKTGRAAECVVLESSLGFRGTAVREFLGLDRIALLWPSIDLVITADPDACVVRRDLGAFLTEVCPGGIGLVGECYRMRYRDALLLVADLVPFGFKRQRVGTVIQRKWRLGRLGPVWWSDIGLAAVRKGFRFRYITGSFHFLGGATLRKLAAVGWLSRPQDRIGFTFTDDVLLTLAAYAIGDPVVDLVENSPEWGFLGITEEKPLDEIVPYRPYVVHHLKDRPQAWARRGELRLALGWNEATPPADVTGASRRI